MSNKNNGRKTEFEQELLKSNKTLNSSSSIVKAILELHGHKTKAAFVLNSVLERKKEVYFILVDAFYLVILEIEIEQQENYLISHITLDDYLIGLTESGQLKLSIAQKLAKSIM